MKRRAFLTGLGALGCSGAAFPWLSTVTLAGSPGGALGDNRLVVVILRGAMDGLDLVQPLGDRAFAAARPTLGTGEGTHDLDGFFALHGRAAGLLPLWAAGELAFVQAASTPYRDKRSHFDGQDLLEAGTGMDVPPGFLREGWLNRMLQAVPGLTAETAFAVGREAMPLLAGRAPTLSWAPEQRLPLSAQGRLLLEHLYHDDDLFREAAEGALALSDAAGDDEDEGMAAGGMEAPATGRVGDVDALAAFAAERLRGETRIATFSLSGWDTHRAQGTTMGAPLQRLERIVLRLRGDLGPAVWGRTVLVAMTEFGRTVRENGSRGTDHGTGGAMLLAGGALRGGRVLGRWPGLEEAALYDRRDLMPTSDVRLWAAGAMRGLFGLDAGLLAGAVFPGLDAAGGLPDLLL